MILTAAIVLALAQRQAVALPQITIQHRWECGALARVPIAVPPAPANATAVRLSISAHFAGETWIENTGAKPRAAGTWDVGARFQIGVASKSMRACFDYDALPGYACHGPNADGEFDGKGAAGRTWTVDHALVDEIVITDPIAIARWRRTALDGLHHEQLVVAPELDSSGEIYQRLGVMWRGEVALDAATLSVEYR